MNGLEQIEQTLLAIKALTKGSAFEAALAELNTTLVALLSRLEKSDADPGAEAAMRERKAAALDSVSQSLRMLLEIVQAKQAHEAQCEPEEQAMRERKVKAIEGIADAVGSGMRGNVVVQIDHAALASAIVQGLRQQQGPRVVTKTTGTRGETIYRIGSEAA